MDIEKFLKTKGTSILLSYVRPLIAHMTVDAGYSPLVLPFVNLEGETQELI